MWTSVVRNLNCAHLQGAAPTSWCSAAACGGSRALEAHHYRALVPPVLSAFVLIVCSPLVDSGGEQAFQKAFFRGLGLSPKSLLVASTRFAKRLT